MASTAMDEDLLSCVFCKKEFDGKVRIPKFLPCRHQTVCLQCIRKVNYSTFQFNYTLPITVDSFENVGFKQKRVH